MQYTIFETTIVDRIALSIMIDGVPSIPTMLAIFSISADPLLLKILQELEFSAAAAAEQEKEENEE